ncbi:MAG TPA: hypothetical protein PKD64_06815 [Pirellulaceae bacterium]|nr:hypothetical protein [Pirellulaceae bacterium]HMO91894.1 hypothetical protein [Pirellulaceae bacterium]HMP68694.1 hypothetical protein [Pirellulaceae bacterium]
MSSTNSVNEPPNRTEFPIYSATKEPFDWHNAMPWLIIFRALSAASRPTVVILALLGCLFSPLGYWIGEYLFIGESVREAADYNPVEFQLYRSPYRKVFPETPGSSAGIVFLGYRLLGLDLIYQQHIDGPIRLMGRDIGIRRFTYHLFGWIWSITVWVFVATCISRIAAMKLAKNEMISMDEAVTYGRRKFVAAYTGILIPIFGVCVLAIPLALTGLIMKLDVGLFIASFFWIFALLLGLLMMVLLFGLLLAWPLIIASVATENQDSFDAMSRSFAYAYRRLPHYLWYAIVALVFGGVVWAITHKFTEGVIHLAYWSSSFGIEFAGGDPKRQLADVDSFFLASQADANDGDLSWFFVAGKQIIGYWDAFARTIGAAFFHGFFWCVASAIYLLLRRDLDEIDLCEVSLFPKGDIDDLPELEIDEDGIPQIRDNLPGSQSEAEPNDDATANRQDTEGDNNRDLR